MRKRIVAMFVLALMLVSIAGSFETAFAQEYAPFLIGRASIAAVKVKSITLSAKSKTLYVGEAAYQAVATVEPSDATNPILTWKSSDSKVAAVDGNGLITPKKAGKATITATAGDGSKKKASISVTVKNVVPTSVSLSETSVTLKPGAKVALIPTVEPANATIKGVTWTSSNKTKATVSGSGLVTAKKPGTVRITATTKSGKKKAVCTVYIPKPITPTSVSLDETKKTVYIGDTFTLAATVFPDNAENKAVTWSSSNKKIAAVSGAGVVTAKKAGTAKITVKTKSASKKKTCTVTVKPIVPTDVSLNYAAYTMKPKQSVALSATVLPANATNKAVTWSTSNSKIATVSSKGVVKAVKNGTSTIKAKTKSGAKVAECKISVTSAGEILPAGIALSDSRLRLGLNDSFTLAATVSPADASDQSVTWVSGDPAVATVTGAGVVTARKEGTATITATTFRGGKIAKCEITVVNEVAPASVQLNHAQYAMNSAATLQLTASVSPANASDQSLTWSSDNLGVATVDSYGRVTAKAAGKATITVMTNTGSRRASCRITVSLKADTAVYRAFMIGNSSYAGNPLKGPELDIEVMKAVLTSGQFKSENIYAYKNRTTAQMQDILRSMQNYNIKDSDVTLFYYSGHGLSGVMPGALMGVEYASAIPVSAVQAYLDQIPGTVIVVLDSCISGQYIQSKAVASQYTASMSGEESVRAFNKAYVDAFGAASVQSRALTDSPYSGKYKILTAASWQDDGVNGISYSTNGFSPAGDYIGVFTNYFANGSGYYPFATSKLASSIPADTSGDRAVSLAEMYAYTSKYVSDYLTKISTSKSKYIQNVMVYPSGDSTAIVTRP